MGRGMGIEIEVEGCRGRNMGRGNIIQVWSRVSGDYDSVQSIAYSRWRYYMIKDDIRYCVIGHDIIG